MDDWSAEADQEREAAVPGEVHFASAADPGAVDELAAFCDERPPAIVAILDAAKDRDFVARRLTLEQQAEARKIARELLDRIERRKDLARAPEHPLR